MAYQLTDPSFIAGNDTDLILQWWDYYWVYLFAFSIGFATTVAEPSLLAVAIKANQVSAGAISTWGLRFAVAIGVAIGIALGVFRIITGTPLYWYIITGYVFVLVQTMFAPRMIIALAYDSGGVTTSTVTVPLVAALGLGLAGTVPGRNPLLDGFWPDRVCQPLPDHVGAGLCATNRMEKQPQPGIRISEQSNQ